MRCPRPMSRSHRSRCRLSGEVLCESWGSHATVPDGDGCDKRHGDRTSPCEARVLPLAGRARPVSAAGSTPTASNSSRASAMSRNLDFGSRSGTSAAGAATRRRLRRQPAPVDLLLRTQRGCRKRSRLRRAASGKHLVEDDSERPNVGAPVDGLPRACSGTYRRRPQDHTGRRATTGDGGRVRSCPESTRPRRAPSRGQNPDLDLPSVVSLMLAGFSPGERSRSRAPPRARQRSDARLRPLLRPAFALL